MSRDAICVLDFGGQYVHLIATRIRAFGVFAEIRDPDDPVDSFKDYKGIILSGSPALSAFDDENQWSRGVMDLGIPVLGFCFGHQEIAKHAGGTVEHTQREYGAATLHITKDTPIFKGLAKEEQVWMSHGDTVTSIPEGFVETGYSTGGIDTDLDHHFAAIANEALKQYGFQFHPEVDDTPGGETMLKNFVLDICQAKAEWSVGAQVGDRLQEVCQEVGDKDVLLLASGGVDSTVAALLYKKAIGNKRLKLLHIDNGLMRLNESKQVEEKYDEIGLGESLSVIDASKEFLEALEGLTDPEAKRTAIGNTFIEVFEREAKAMNFEHALLGQGTIYPDTIETGGAKRAETIKTHHNRVPLVEEMIRQGKVSEPLKDLYKPEVRELGAALGLDVESIDRHPFPGPGLGIRVACSPGSFHDDFDPQAIQSGVDRELKGTKLRGRPLPVKSVGVKADLRSYEHPVLMAGPNPGWERLETTTTHLVKTVPGINRCLYLLSDVFPQTVEVRAATLTQERLDLLREIDDFVMQGLKRHNLMKVVWQCPTILIPMVWDGRAGELVAIRPIRSERAMTARPAWIGDELALEIVQKVGEFEQFLGVAIDTTTKPPATIEWE